MDLSSLNLEQLEAVLHKDGPLLVFAGAGSGKTRVITYRIAHLIREHRVPPRHILAVTFTNKAADELKERLTHLLEGSEVRGLWVGTFHAICARILRESGRAIDIPPNFLVYDEGDQLDVVRRVLVDLDIDEKQMNPRAIRNAISRAKERLTTPEQYREQASDYFERIVAAVYPRYEAYLRAANALDFDDLINKVIELLETQPHVRERYQDQFRYILVDEYQDVNYAQYVLTRLLAEKHRNLCVVGDDDQAIYGFRGAEVELILRFEQDFPDAKVVKLEQNYRSTQTILDAAMKVISQNRFRAPKTLWTTRTGGAPVTLTPARDEDEEARIVAEYILQQVRLGKRRFSDFAVLYRTNAQSRAFEERFMRERIPHQLVGALRFYDRKEVKDILAYLRLVANPDDSVSLLRIINTPPRKIGQATVREVQAFAAERGISLYRALSDPELHARLGSAAQRALLSFVSLIERLREYAQQHSLSDTLKEILRQTGYLEWLQSRRDYESVERVGNVRELVGIALQFETRDALRELEPEEAELSPIMRFLQHVSLASDVDALDEREDRVVLMTLHSAKGLEFPVVFLVGMEQGLLPHALSESPKEIEEERRLCYVGMTRAKDELHLTYALSRGGYEGRRSTLPSPFLRALVVQPMPTLYQVMYGAVASRLSTPSVWQGAARGKSEAPFLPGQRVRHPELGTGVVVRASEANVTVMFPGGKGMRTFSLLDCPLEEA
ncbi:MAG: UvrD-helicase domain-containing protein [Fimbriimonadales bacterium]|nr:UvrD-helicase domain-containing protein [Fimbriimonadales bacterium]